MIRTKNKSPAVSVDDAARKVIEKLGDEWIPKIYQREILGGRSRSYRLPVPTRVIEPTIVHTLLGIELKIGRWRLLVPDLATARYLSVFARLAVGEVAIPYDITKVSRLADRLESSLQRARLLIEPLAGGRSQRFSTLVKSRLFDEMRREIQALGGGELYPQFDTSTKQRR